jgi:hypothetical protein
LNENLDLAFRYIKSISDTKNLGSSASGMIGLVVVESIFLTGTTACTTAAESAVAVDLPLGRWQAECAKAKENMRLAYRNLFFFIF